jgi:hypothetical protein
LLLLSLQEEYKYNILNSRDVAGDDLVRRIVPMVEAQIPSNLAPEDRRIAIERAILNKLDKVSAALKMKLTSLARAFMASKMEADLNELLYRMPVLQMTQKEKSECYGRMLSVLMDDPSRVSYATGNPMHLGKVAPVDVWFLTIFAFVTCARIRGDNLLQLGCVGMSTCGKLTTIEVPIQATIHQLLSSASNRGGNTGVGRFEVGMRNVVFLRDISINVLFGADFDKLKAIARAGDIAG